MPRKIALLLAGLYCFFIPFGDVLRRGEEASLGLASLLIAGFVLISINRHMLAALMHPLALVLSAMIFLSVVGLISYPGNFVAGLTRTAATYFYVVVLVAAVSIETRGDELDRIINFLVCGMLVASTIAIVDSLGFYKFSFLKDAATASKVDGQQIEQAGGFFSRRSAMAAVYAVAVPLMAVIGLKKNTLVMRCLYLAASSVSWIALFLTHNRSGVLAIVAVVLWYIVYYSEGSLAKRLGSSLITVVVAGAFFAVVSIYFSEDLFVYVEKLSFLVEKDGEASRSDASRIYFFIEAIKSLGSSPLGNGFTLMYTDLYGFKSPHNIITYLIWATGVLSFVWLPLLFVQFKKSLRSNRYKTSSSEFYVLAIKLGVISFMLNNMTHNSFNTGIFWLLLGLGIGHRIMERKLIRKRSKERNII